MKTYHTNKPPAGDPVVMPGPAPIPSPRPPLPPMPNETPAQVAATADKYIAPNGGAPVAPAAPAPTPAADPAAQPDAAPAPGMSALSALADAFATLPGEVNAMAAEALTRLNSAKAAAKTGVAKIHTVAAGIEKTTKQIEDFASRISNVPL